MAQYSLDSTPHDGDELMRRALKSAAANVPSNPKRDSFLEALLEQALVAAWEIQAPGGVARPRSAIAVPGWDPRPGATDLALSITDERHPTLIAELKVLDVDQTLWDLIKLLSIIDSDGPYVRGYLVVATTPKRWRDAEAAALYAPPDDGCPDGVRDWLTEELLFRWARSWTYLLKGGRGRPRDVPARVRTTFLGAHPVPTFPEYELRAIAVEPLPSSRQLRFGDDGFPTPRAGDRGFGLRDLLDAHVTARRYRHAHPDLRDYYDARATAAASAFGIDLDKPRSDDSALAHLLSVTLTQIEGIDSPFGAYLEAPKSVHEPYKRHGIYIAHANSALHDRLADLAVDVIAALRRTDPGATVSLADLAAHGFDSTAPAPDPLDYW